MMGCCRCPRHARSPGGGARREQKYCPRTLTWALGRTSSSHPRSGHRPDHERLLTEDPDPEVRLKICLRIIGCLVLCSGLSDIDKNVRLASLEALGEMGDPSVSTWITALLRDVEPDVRIEALRTLGLFQDKRKAEFKSLAEKLRKDYEEAVRRAASRR